MADTGTQGSEGERAPHLRIDRINKAFGENRVLKDVTLDFPPGVFVGLMGPNGAGKSTLIKILDGVYSSDSGTITLDGEEVRNLDSHPKCGFIHQDLGLIEGMTITENLRLGQDPVRLAGPVLNIGREREMAKRALDRVGLQRSVDTPIHSLSAGEKTQVAIARTLDQGARIIFVDEATSTLPHTQSMELIEALKRTVSTGATVIMVSHKLSEILEGTDRVVVLLDGEIATDEATSGLDRESLVDRLVAAESSVTVEGREQAVPAEPGRELVHLIDAYGGRAGPVNLTLRGGEILGLTGLPGSGLHDIGFLVDGAMKPQSGGVEFAKGVRTALVPPHRETQGGIATETVRENLTLSSLPAWRTFTRLLSLRREAADAQEMSDELHVTPGDVEGSYQVLSGGNKQKVIFGRSLLRRPDVYVLCEPTRGVDVTTRSEIYRLILSLRSPDTSVLVVSSDSEDLFAVCDRIGVVGDGSVSDLVPASEMNTQQLEALV